MSGEGERDSIIVKKAFVASPHKCGQRVKTRVKNDRVVRVACLTPISGTQKLSNYGL